MDVGESTEGGERLASKAESIEGVEIFVTAELRGVVLQRCNFLSTTLAGSVDEV